MVLLVAVVVSAVVVAVSATGKPLTGLHLALPGHWVAFPGLDRVFHINGAAKNVDASAEVPGLEAGSQVVQGETSGYVVGRSRIVEFGKSNLTVKRSLTPPTGEVPVAVETAGGPYLVYREAGRVVRLGENTATIPAGGVLGAPVATTDGTLWLHRLDSGVLCHLPRGAEQVSCPVAVPTGHTGALTVVGQRAAFVDTTADTVRALTPDGLGEPVPLRMDIPTNARVSPVDAAGRLAVLDPSAGLLHLVDAAGLDGRRTPTAPVSVNLGHGDYAGPTASGSSVVLLDLGRSAVLTYGSDGLPQKSVQVPREAGEPRLSRGEDARVYVDSAEGGHVLVVDRDGAVSQVSLVAPERPAPSPPVVQPEQSLAQPEQPVAQPRRPVAQPPPAPPRRTPVPASPPGIPPGLTATVQGADVLLNWGAAPGNGAAVSAYHVSWKPTSGSGGAAVTRPGTARSATLTGLQQGVVHTVSLVAENGAGRGAPATTQVTVPVQRIPVVTVTRGRDATYEGCEAPDCALMHVELRGFRPNTRYEVEVFSDAPGYSNPGSGQTTDDEGNITFEAFHFDGVGYHVWIEVDGVRSNRYQWPGG